MQYGCTDAHSQKKTKKRENFCYSVPILVTAAKAPTNQHLKPRYSKSDVSKKKIINKGCHHPIKDYRFSP
jgi:hypothetical protein